MKVSSPVGEFPFEVRGVSLRAGGVRLEGAMGAWPAHVEIGLADVPALLRAAPAPVVVVAVAVASAALGALLFSTRRRSHR